MKMLIAIAVVLFVGANCIAGDKVEDLLSKLSHSKNESERVDIISRELWAIDDPRIEEDFMKKLTSNPTREDYYIAQYLAKKGVVKAMAILCANSSKYPISSLQWAYTLKEFGIHKYEPAIPFLIDGLGAASLNVVDEAFHALRVFYPESPSDFSSIQEMKTYFENMYDAANRRIRTEPSQAPGR